MYFAQWTIDSHLYCRRWLVIPIVLCNGWSISIVLDGGWSGAYCFHEFHNSYCQFASLLQGEVPFADPLDPQFSTKTLYACAHGTHPPLLLYRVSSIETVHSVMAGAQRVIRSFDKDRYCIII